ncbi:MAG: hypothetical protein WDN76_04960 [Alphaproteobacteria bacterium]
MDSISVVVIGLLVIIVLAQQGRKAIGPLKVAADDIFGGAKPLSFSAPRVNIGKWLLPVIVLLVIAAVAAPQFIRYMTLASYHSSPDATLPYSPPIEESATTEAPAAAPAPAENRAAGFRLPAPRQLAFRDRNLWLFRLHAERHNDRLQ